MRDVAIVAFPDRRAGTGLYAFVEGSAEDRELRDYLGHSGPEHLQIVDALPRDDYTGGVIGTGGRQR